MQDGYCWTTVMLSPTSSMKRTGSIMALKDYGRMGNLLISRTIQAMQISGGYCNELFREVDKNGRKNGRKANSINLTVTSWTRNCIVLKCFLIRQGLNFM